MSKDQINPEHYKGDLVMRIIEHFNLGFNLGNAAKYILRAGEKLQGSETQEEAEIRDLNKAKWYIDRRIMELEGNERIGNLGSMLDVKTITIGSGGPENKK